MEVKGTGREDVNWVRVAQGRVQRRAVVNTVMNIRRVIKNG
jgi:hypothetical protein